MIRESTITHCRQTQGTFHTKLDQDERKPFFSCTRCLVYTTRTQTQSDHCLTNVNVDRSAVFSPDLSQTFPFINRMGSFQILQLLVSVFKFY